jgi:phospholipase A1
MATDILVFVPGTLGSELWDDDDRVWPGSIREALSGFSKERFEILLKEDLDPRDIVRSAAGGLVGVYRSWIEAFEAIQRDRIRIFREKPAPMLPKTLYVFPYDWRRDLVATATKLADLLDTILAGQPDADLKVVCHSMGGVVARYYLESGMYATRSAFQKVSLLATFGTPHNGAPVAFAGAVGLHKAQFLSVAQTKQLANDERYPSLYQLFPVPTHSFIWAFDSNDAIKDYPADDPGLVTQFRLSTKSLGAWKAFRTGLSGRRPDHVRYFYIVGTRQETLTRLRLSKTTLTTEEVDDAGDGTVPLLGAMDPKIQSQFVGKSHLSLIETQIARATLAALFGADTLFAVAPGVTITLAVRDTDVTTSDVIHVLVEFSPSVNQFQGILRFQRARDPAPDRTLDAPVFADTMTVAEIPIELGGAQFTDISLRIPPIEARGIYRPILKTTGARDECVGPVFAVRQPVS